MLRVLKYISFNIVFVEFSGVHSGACAFVYYRLRTLVIQSKTFVFSATIEAGSRIYNRINEIDLNISSLTLLEHIHLKVKR